MGLVSFAVGALGFVIAILVALAIFGHISKTGKPSMADGIGALIAAIAVIGGLSVAHSFGQIEAGTVGLQKSFGIYTGKEFTGGMYSTTPVVTSVEVVDLHNKHVDLPEQMLMTADKYPVPVNASINYKLGGTAQQLIATMTVNGQNYYQNTVEAQFISALRATIAQYRFADINGRLDPISQLVMADTLRRMHELQGTDAIQIQQVNIKRIDPPAAFKDSIEKTMIAQQNVQTAKQELLKVQYDTQQAVVKAKGQAESQKYQSRTITPEYLRLKTIEVMTAAVDKWDGKISPFSANPFGAASAMGGSQILDARDLGISGALSK